MTDLNKKKEKRYLKENNVFEGGWLNVRRPAAKCTFMMLTSKTYLKIMKWFIRTRIPKNTSLPCNSHNMFSEYF